MNHNYLISEWTEKDSEYIFGVVGNFCVRNQLHGSDGLPGLLNFVKKLYREKPICKNLHWLNLLEK